MLVMLSGCGKSTVSPASTGDNVDYTAILEDITTVQKFSEEAVNEEDINAVVTFIK